MKHVERVLRRTLPRLAESRLAISQIDTPGHPSASSTEAAFRVAVDGGKEVLVARLMQEFTLMENCWARFRAIYWGYEPLYKRRRDALHMRQLLFSAGLSPKTLTSDDQFTVELFMKGGSLGPLANGELAEEYWTRLGKLLGAIHSCRLDGFEVKTPMWPDRMRFLASLVQQSGGSPPMPEISNVMSQWPTRGVAAALVPSHGAFAGSSILQEDERILVTDFEYSGLNFAGIDACYLFLHGLFSQGLSEPVMSGGEPKWKSYPSLRHREKFAEAYLEGSGNRGEEEPHAFLLDVERFAPAVGLWAGMSLARKPATRRGSTWFLGYYSEACRAANASTQVDRYRLLREGVWSVACAGA